MRAWPLKNNLLDGSDLDLIYLTKDCVEAFTVVRESFNHFKGGAQSSATPITTIGHNTATKDQSCHMACCAGLSHWRTAGRSLCRWHRLVRVGEKRLDKTAHGAIDPFERMFLI